MKNKRKNILTISAFLTLLLILASFFLVPKLNAAGVSNQGESLVTELPLTDSVVPMDSSFYDSENEIDNGSNIDREFIKTRKLSPDDSITKHSLFKMMLNTVDYFDAVYEKVRVRFAPIMDEEEILVIISDLRNGTAYERLEGNGLKRESFSDGETVKTYDLESKTNILALPTEKYISIAEETQEEDPERIYYNETGKHYLLRSNPTNAFYASYSLLPQEFVFGFLENEDAWNIDEETRLFDRECLVINGTTENYGKKMDVSSFHFVVDKATGILLEYEGRNSAGAITNYMYVTEFDVDSIDIEDMLFEKLEAQKEYMN